MERIEIDSGGTVTIDVNPRPGGGAILYVKRPDAAQAQYVHLTWKEVERVVDELHLAVQLSGANRG